MPELRGKWVYVGDQGLYGPNSVTDPQGVEFGTSLPAWFDDDPSFSQRRVYVEDGVAKDVEFVDASGVRWAEGMRSDGTRYQSVYTGHTEDPWRAPEEGEEVTVRGPVQHTVPDPPAIDDVVRQSPDDHLGDAKGLGGPDPVVYSAGVPQAHTRIDALGGHQDSPDMSNPIKHMGHVKPAVQDQGRAGGSAEETQPQQQAEELARAEQAQNPDLTAQQRAEELERAEQAQGGPQDLAVPSDDPTSHSDGNANGIPNQYGDGPDLDGNGVPDEVGINPDSLQPGYPNTPELVPYQGYIPFFPMLQDFTSGEWGNAQPVEIPKLHNQDPIPAELFDPSAPGPTLDPALFNPNAAGPTLDPAVLDPYSPGPTIEPSLLDANSPGPTLDLNLLDVAAPGPTLDAALLDPNSPGLSIDPNLLDASAPGETIDPAQLDPMSPGPTLEPAQLENSLVQADSRIAKPGGVADHHGFTDPSLTQEEPAPVEPQAPDNALDDHQPDVW